MLVKIDFRVVDKYNLAQYTSTGVPWKPSVPHNIYWGYVSFKGSVRVPRSFLGEMISCFSVLMRHYENF